MIDTQGHVDLTLDVEGGTPPAQLATMLTEKGLTPLFQHASSKHFARRTLSRSFEDGIDANLVRIIEEYYTSLLRDTELAGNFTAIRLRLIDWITKFGVEVAEVQIENIGQEDSTPQDNANGAEARIAVFMPPKLPGPNVALHNPFGQGRTSITPNRSIAAEILPKNKTPPANRSIAKTTGETMEGNETRIQEPGDTLMITTAVQSALWNMRSHLHEIANFQKLDASRKQYHQLTEVPWRSTPPVAVFAQTLK